MQINKDNLTIVIVTIKSENVIKKCLNSIDKDVKKIIIENSSDKNLFEELKKEYANIECFATGENFGMGKANNIGIQKSKTRYVMVLNPDTILKKNTLSELFKYSDGLDFAILSPISDDKDYPNYKIIKNQITNNKNLLEVDYVDGYSMILDKEKFNQNYFDENIFMYLENDDLCLRTKKNRQKIYVLKTSLINHLGAKTVNEMFTTELELSRNWHWSWSKFYYQKKHSGFFIALIKGLPLFIRSCIKYFFYILIRDKFKSKIYFNRASGFYNSLINEKSWYRPRLD